MTSTTVNPNLFHGYSVQLLQGIAGLGPSLVDDPDLYAAAQAYAATMVPGSTSALGPAILSTEPVQSVTAHKLPPEMQRPAPTPAKADEDSGWDKYELADLIAKAKEHGVVLGRVKTPGKLIAALEAAGVAP